MEPIRVPGPPKTAFNKDRRVSDLIRAQTDHLKHLEFKLPAAVRATLPQHGITTEQDAALYIAAMTKLLRGQTVGADSATKTAPIPISAGRRPVPVAVTETDTLAIAAAADAGGEDSEKNGGASK